MFIVRKFSRYSCLKWIVLLIIAVKLTIISRNYWSEDDNRTAKVNNRHQPSQKRGSSTVCLQPYGVDCFPNLAELFPLPRKESIYLPRKMHEQDYNTLIRLINLTLTVFKEHSIGYTVSTGGLIGSYVMHDLLPWDDHIDLLIHKNNKKRVLDLFKDGRHFGILAYQNLNQPSKAVKIFFSTALNAGIYPWKWPFIDVETYIEDGADRFKLADRSDVNYYWPQESYFPTHLRPFGPLWINSPKDPKTFLKAIYSKPFSCRSSHWDSEKEVLRTVIRADCDLLTNHYPFVKRSPFSNITKETLVMNATEYYNIVVDESYSESNIKFGW